MEKGFFITLEGIDGSGKSTQAQLLFEYLQELGYQVLLTREPGGTPLAEEIRRVILTPGEEELDPMAEILLYTAARAQHVNSLIKPALAAGKIVISERFVHSTLAYQGYGLGRDLNLIKEISNLATGGLKPDLTFLFDAAPHLTGERVKQRSKNGVGSDRIEMRGLSFQERVRNGFLSLAAEDPGIVIVNTTGKGIKSIFAELTAMVVQRLK